MDNIIAALERHDRVGNHRQGHLEFGFGIGFGSNATAISRSDTTDPQAAF